MAIQSKENYLGPLPENLSQVTLVRIWGESGVSGRVREGLQTVSPISTVDFYTLGVWKRLKFFAIYCHNCYFDVLFFFYYFYIYHYHLCEISVKCFLWGWMIGGWIPKRHFHHNASNIVGSNGTHRSIRYNLYLRCYLAGKHILAPIRPLHVQKPLNSFPLC